MSILKDTSIKSKFKKGVLTITITLSVLLGGNALIQTDDVEIPLPTDNGVVISEISLGEVEYDAVVDVLRVVDGDTFEVDYEGEKVKIRPIGVDTPETVHPKMPVQFWGVEASNFTKELLTDKAVYLDFDEGKYDYYGRLLAYVYLENGDMFNLILLNRGYAEAKFYPPNIKYQELFLDVEDKAKDKKLGIWDYEARQLWESTNLE